VADKTDIYEWLRPPAPTSEDEVCSCSGEPPIKLMSMRSVSGFNPIHCLDCNREVPPERLVLDLDMIQAIAFWDAGHGAIETLELQSGQYETWARARLLDPESPTNAEGRELAQRLNERRRCYMWFFQPESDDDWRPRETCPVCGNALEHYEHGIFPQLLCERDRLVLVGGD
jgi:predicted  nucleic acid-binding Zn ribbon protein